MASTEKLEAQILAEMESNPEAYADTEIEYCTVDDDTRVVTVPEKYRKLGVESDEAAKRVWFRFPKLVGNNGIDLSTVSVRVNFRNANGGGDIYMVQDLTADGDNVVFSWELSRKATAYKGSVSFVVCAVKSNMDGTTKNEWNTTLNRECEVLEGLEVSEQITQENPDIIEYILANLGGSVSPEQIAAAVEEYLIGNPPSGMTADEKAQLNKNTEDISQLSEEIRDLGGGLTAAQITALDGMFKVAAYDTTKDYAGAYTAFKQAFGIESGGGEIEPDEPIEPGGPEITLTAISATYTGGEVVVGTALTDLAGITVTATYSDGSMETVKDYTLSGEIAEGENTVTVSCGGLTTTITVTGIAVPEADWENGVNYTFTVTENSSADKITGAIIEKSGENRTDYLNCYGAEYIKASWCTAFFYGANKAYISNSSGESSSVNRDYWAVPSNAVYCIVVGDDNTLTSETEIYPCAKVEPTWNDGVPYELELVNDVYLENGKDVDYTGWSKTQKVNISGVKKLVVEPKIGNYNDVYDGAGKFIAKINTYNNITLYAFYKYAAFSGSTAQMETLTVTPYANADS